jgi:predicted kinase
VPTLTITRGLPGSGKTTWARAQGGHVRVNRDELRRMLHGGPLLTGWAEIQVTLAQRAQVDALLRAGVNVICDDTNLRAQTVRDLAELGRSCGAEVVVRDFTEVPVDECVARDAARPEDERVGEQTIRDMYRRHLARRSLPLPVPAAALPAVAPVEPYLPPDGAPEAFLVDIDGTVALDRLRGAAPTSYAAVTNGRGPYEEHRVSEDLPNPPVIAVVRALHAAGYRLVFCSGRSESCREDTAGWLAAHVAVPYDELLMRASGDGRMDAVVKAELFDRHVRDRYRIVAVLDDRDQVVRAWRSMGLTVLQVGEGNF